MKRENSLRGFLIKRFIFVLFLIGCLEFILMKLLNHLVIPVIQYNFFSINENTQELTMNEILVLILFIFVEIILLAINSAIPSIFFNFIPYIRVRIQNNRLDYIPSVKDKISVSELDSVERLLLFLLMVAIIMLILLPFVVGSIYFSYIVTKQVDKINENERKIHFEYNKKRNLLLADIAHDLRTPITTISGYAKALDDGLITSPDKAKEYYKLIYNKSMRINELMTLLFEYVKLDSDGFTLNMETVDIAELLRTNTATYYSDIEDASMELNIEIPEKECIFQVDSLQFSRVIGNIISNAIKHNQKGTQILVKLENNYGVYRIIIADTGSPIDKEVADTIFEPFAIGDESRSSKGGSGLGLSIAAKVVRMHGWDIKLDTYPGYTKAFIINLKEDNYKKIRYRNIKNHKW